jgi:hypothetical protein
MQTEHGLLDDIVGIETGLISAIFIFLIAPFLSMLDQ